MVGRPLEKDTCRALAQQKWLDLNLLTSVQQNSPYYNQRDKMAIFYAQSWALTHMLVLGKDYQAGFSRFVASVSAGNSAEASFASVYGKTLGQVRADFNRYFQQTTVTDFLLERSKCKRLICSRWWRVSLLWEHRQPGPDRSSSCLFPAEQGRRGEKQTRWNGGRVPGECGDRRIARLLHVAGW